MSEVDKPPTQPSSKDQTREHDLKVWPEFYAPLDSGEKTFELRKDDRGFRAGDTLLLREWNPRMEAYTGNFMRRRVTYLISGLGLQKDFVVMALGSGDETPTERPVAWRHLVDSPYERHPRWHYTEQAPTEEPERFEALYTRRTQETTLTDVHLLETEMHLLAACKAQHEAIDRLFSMLVNLTSQHTPDNVFFPSQSGQPWEATRLAREAILNAEKIL